MIEQLEGFLNKKHKEICTTAGCGNLATFCCQTHHGKFYCVECNIALHSHCQNGMITMPKVLARNTIMINCILDPIYNYISENKCANEIPEIVEELELYRGNVQDLSEDVIDCLEKDQNYRVLELNNEVIKLKNQIDDSYMFTQWLKYTYLKEFTGNTLRNQKIQESVAIKKYGPRSEII